MDRTDFDRVFSCPICFSPSLNMVFGKCQHFICIKCLYDDGRLKRMFSKCPFCNKKKTFPNARPVIHDAIRQLMMLAGVVGCKHKKCDEEMWTWEQQQHEKSRHAAKDSVPVQPAEGSEATVQATTSTPASSTPARKRKRKQE